jgi:peptidoglycan/xylan/chitin deacetylase (PgdA/CDA1 family)
MRTVAAHPLGLQIMRSANKEWFFKVFGRLASNWSLRNLIKTTGQRLIIPVYHLVSDKTPAHIRYLYHAKSKQTFEEDLDFLLSHYRPIDLPELMEKVNEGQSFDENVFLLTFDDGLREFKEVIAPILLKKGVPAICFLNSDFIDNKGLFYRYKVSLLIDYIKKHKLENATLVQAWIRANDFTQNKDIKEILDTITYNQQELLDQLAATVRLNFDNYLEEEQPYMNSEEIKDLIEKGFYFGAHSCDHPLYRYIDLEEQKQQTSKSLYEIKEAFDLDYSLFAFPFTDYKVSKAFFDWIYEREQPLLDLSFGTAGLKQDIYPQHLHRIPLELSDHSAEEVIRREYLYYRFKCFFGRNRMRRR